MYHQIIEDIPIYHGKFAVVITDEEEKLLSEWPDIKDASLGLAYDAFATEIQVEHKEHSCYKHCVILFVINTKCSPLNHLTTGVIAHESLHGVSFLFKRNCVYYDPDNDESFAYMVEFFANKMQWFIDEVKQNPLTQQ